MSIDYDVESAAPAGLARVGRGARGWARRSPLVDPDPSRATEAVESVEPAPLDTSERAQR
jgi:hypothetical protein